MFLKYLASLYFYVDYHERTRKPSKDCERMENASKKLHVFPFGTLKCPFNTGRYKTIINERQIFERTSTAR